MVYELEKEHKKTSLMCKKKEELAKEIMRLEHNVNALNESLHNQANAFKYYEQESRNKAIDEFVEELRGNACYVRLFGHESGEYVVTTECIDRIANQFKGGN